MNSLRDICIFLGLVPKESHCIKSTQSEITLFKKNAKCSTIHYFYWLHKLHKLNYNFFKITTELHLKNDTRNQIFTVFETLACAWEHPSHPIYSHMPVVMFLTFAVPYTVSIFIWVPALHVSYQSPAFNSVKHRFYLNTTSKFSYHLTASTLHLHDRDQMVTDDYRNNHSKILPKTQNWQNIVWPNCKVSEC